MTLKEIQGFINYAPGFDEMQKKLLRTIVEAAFGYTDDEISSYTPPAITITAGAGTTVADGDTVAVTVNEATPGNFTIDLTAGA